MLRIGELVKRGLDGDQLGLEFEVEGKFLPKRVNGFRVVNEGSLRPVEGHDGVEYVTRNPAPLDEIVQSIYDLNALMEEKGAVPVFSHRTSVHVHLNVADLTVAEWFNMLFLWVLYEPALIHYCGENRKGNLFCLSSQEAEGLLFTLAEVARNGDLNHVLNEDVRYAAVNLLATRQYGSLEFRCMRGTLDPAVLVPWVSTIATLKTVAKSFANPEEIVEKALKDIEAFSHDIFAEDHFIYNYPDIFRAAQENLFRLALVLDDLNLDRFNFFDEPFDDI